MLMDENVFHKDELNICDWQYTVRHTDPNAFKRGDIVFLKSNPEFKMVVDNINKNSVTTILDDGETIIFEKFPPECILQYTFASMITYKNKFSININ